MIGNASFDVLIVGGGHGGAQTAIALRQNGYAGSIAIVTDEPEIPYERPPLSKEYLTGEKTADRIRIRPQKFWEDRCIHLILSERIDAVDADNHLVTAASGQRFHYGKLVWAAGGSPRRLSIPHDIATNVLYIRSLADAVRLKELSARADSVVVIGGGYIGLEAAAVLCKAGKKVTLIEVQDRVLARAAGAELARHVEQVHRGHGVDIRLAATICKFLGNCNVEAVHLADGSQIPCDIVIVGIGIVPEIDPLQDAGARCGNGIEIDEYCRTSLPHIFAIGDCAAHRNAYAQCAVIRLESVQNAADMARTVAECILGRCQGYQDVPWFWSNQYDLKIQTIGLSMGYDETVVRGDMATGAFSIIYLRQGRVIALDCVNSAKDYVQGKVLVMAGANIAKNKLADKDIPLKSLFKHGLG